MKFILMRTFEGSNTYVVHSTVIIFIYFLKKVVSLFFLTLAVSIVLAPVQKSNRR